MRARRQAIWVAAILVLVAVLLYALVGFGYWRGVSGGRTVSIPGRYGHVWLEHQPWRMEDAAPPPMAPVPFAVVYGPNVVGQSFRAAAGNLARIRFWLDGLPGQKVYLGLSKEGDPSAALHAGVVTLRDGERGGYYDLSFPPIRDSKAQLYVAWVRAPEATVEQPVALRIAPGDVVGGRPTLNGRPASGNLDFATYHRGWPGGWWLDVLREQVLPGVFRVRIQQYKPTWAKGVTFGALVTGGAFLSAVLFLVAWPDEMSWSWRVGSLLTFVLLCSVAYELAGDGVLFQAADATLVPKVPAIAAPRAVFDALMSDRPVGLEAARDPVPVEWVPGDTTRDGCYALLTTGDRPFTFKAHLVPGAALRFGVRAETAHTMVDVYWNGERIWQGQADREWIQVELDLTHYASSKGTIGLGGLGEVWWSSPHLVSDERWLLPYPLPEGMLPSALPVRFGDEVELLGYDLDVVDARPGGAVGVTLYWHALRPIDVDYTVFVHLLDQDGEMRGQGDGRPVDGGYPTDIWPLDAVIADHHSVPLAADLPPGTCRLAVGLYDLVTLDRLPARETSGQVVPDGRLILEPFVVGE